ncbi:MAG TPA: hypothetical protein VFG76_01385 [Candidatus Polarisedimenticolia bacterium]|nr:hypothetical protein [Candidatus Polarisedimenticolia bacterium]
MSVSETASSRRFFSVYQYVVPALLFPASYLLWLRRFDGDHGLVALALSVPVVFAYVVPGIGTNVLKLWEFNTRLRLGRFRPHHGFVFGTAASLFALCALERLGRPVEQQDVLRAGFVLGSILGFWNWLYDVAAIRSGFLAVYNRPWAEGRGPEAIAGDYAPTLFGVFGVCYGCSLRLGEHVVLDLGRRDLLPVVALSCNLATLALPVAAHVLVSWLRNGEWGLSPQGRG